MTLHQRRIELTIFCTLFLVLCYAAFCQSSQRQLAQDIVRLRVVANSDSEADQRTKLAVRDAVLGEIAGWSNQADSAEQMTELLLKRQDELMSTVKQTLRRQDAPEECRIVIAESDYPTRHYDGFSLPAGRYQGMQIFLGSGQGHNWWCVVYPALCIDAASAEDELSDDERGVIYTENAEYAVRFKTAELIGELEAMLS